MVCLAEHFRSLVEICVLLKSKLYHIEFVTIKRVVNLNTFPAGPCNAANKERIMYSGKFDLMVNST